MALLGSDGCAPRRPGSSLDRLEAAWLALKLVALGLAATLGSPMQQRQIDYSTGAPDDQGITQLWLVTYVNEKGLEVVAQAKLQSGDHAPLIVADFERLASNAASRS
jgi:hypothetical protein